MLIADRPFCPYGLSDAQMESITQQIKQQELSSHYRLFMEQDELDIWVEDIIIFWEQIYFDIHQKTWRIPWVYHTVVEQNPPHQSTITYRFFSKTGWIAYFDKNFTLINATEDIYE